MLYTLHISARAEDDTLNAIDYYDLISYKLGSRFVEELFEVYQSIQSNPALYSFISVKEKTQFRDVKLKSFPYVVIYETSENDIYITAVLNTHKKPFIP